MPSLTDSEKIAGRYFRHLSQTRLEESHVSDSPTFVPPPWLRHYRHNCLLRGDRSTSLELKEVYVFSPELWVCYCSAIDELKLGSFPHSDCQGGKVLSVEGRFGFIYKEGKCACGATARSIVGRLVDAWERPPITGRVVRPSAVEREK